MPLSGPGRTGGGRQSSCIAQEAPFFVTGEGLSPDPARIVPAAVQPEQDVLINGVGLGAIPSDETQSGFTGVPATTIQALTVSGPDITSIAYGAGYSLTLKYQSQWSR